MSVITVVCVFTDILLVWYISCNIILGSHSMMKSNYVYSYGQHITKYFLINFKLHRELIGFLKISYHQPLRSLNHRLKQLPTKQETVSFNKQLIQFIEPQQVFQANQQLIWLKPDMKLRRKNRRNLSKNEKVNDEERVDNLSSN